MTSLRKEEEWLLKEKHDGKRTEAFAADLLRLRSGEPLAYVIGWVDFLGSRIDLSGHPLIPRPETEYWTECVLHELAETRKKDLRLLDVCAGSGCIGIALLRHIPDGHVDLADIDAKLLPLIKKNAVEAGIAPERYNVIHSDLFENTPGRYDAIMANPPYIPEGSADVAPSVRAHEPALALYSGKDGLAIIDRIFKDAKEHIEEDGVLYVEFGKGQERGIVTLGNRHGWEVKIRNDQYGIPRWCAARLS